MYKITLTYNAGMNPNVYTNEIETCTNKEWLHKKKERMLDRWLKILIDGLAQINNDDDRLFTKNHVIQDIINLMNVVDHKHRYFSIETKEIEIKNDDENL